MCRPASVSAGPAPVEHREAVGRGAAGLEEAGRVLATRSRPVEAVGGQLGDAAAAVRATLQVLDDRSGRGVVEPAQAVGVQGLVGRVEGLRGVHELRLPRQVRDVEFTPWDRRSGGMPPGTVSAPSEDPQCERLSVSHPHAVDDEAPLIPPIVTLTVRGKHHAIEPRAAGCLLVGPSEEQGRAGERPGPAQLPGH